MPLHYLLPLLSSSFSKCTYPLTGNKLNVYIWSTGKGGRFIQEAGTERKSTLFMAVNHIAFLVSVAHAREKHKVTPLWSLFSSLCIFQVYSYSRPVHDRELTVTSNQESQLATWLGQTSLSLPRAALGPEILQIILYLSVFNQLARPALLVPFVHRSSEEKGAQDR